MEKQLKIVLVGAGHRGICYTDYALEYPEKMKVVAIVEPNDFVRGQFLKKHAIPEDMQFKNVDELVQKGKIADAAINATMDNLHLSTSLPLLKAGYDLLLEKPITVNEDELITLYETAKSLKRTVMICHVLRYAPFYSEIKKCILNGDIGDIINIQTNEHVVYHHMSVGYVRGKWNNKEKCGSPILMAKSCHDLDIITWLANDIPVKVSSFGGLHYFTKDNAPKNSGNRCLCDCPKDVENNCLYSARKIYLNHPDRWDFFVWHDLEVQLGRKATLEEKEQSLKTDNPHGRCVYKCDNDVMDRQSVMILFKNGVTATHNLVTGTSKRGRYIHIVGTKGEIHGNFEDMFFNLYKANPDLYEDADMKKADIKCDTGGHGGGDIRLIADFVDYLNGAPVSISCTKLENSIYGHLIGFMADKSLVNNGMAIEIKQI